MRSSEATTESNPAARATPVHEFVGRRIAETHRVAQAALDLRMRALGADFTTWKVLAHLVHGGLPSQRELAARMLIDPATLVRHLDRVEAEGLVVRERDERDRRILRVVITPEGRERHTELHRVVEQFDRELRAQLEPSQCQALFAALRRITEYVSTDLTKERADGARVS
ncbi:MAG: winged helix-turn-helix transcriptional regulator [Actinobacteria bacterium]|nr:winged helix-turn-helix transcriptional regulator [Actinomycetota bacterium]